MFFVLTYGCQIVRYLTKNRFFRWNSCKYLKFNKVIKGMMYILGCVDGIYYAGSKKEALINGMTQELRRLA